MTDTAPLPARGPDDLLALVPSMLGFHPTDSVVVLTVGAAAQPFHARVDLPAGPADREALAGYLADVTRRNGTTRLAVVVYSDDPGGADALVDDLAPRLRRIDVELVCAVRADGARWWALPADAGDTGTAYDVRSHPWMAQAVLDGVLVLGSRQELAASLVGTNREEIARVGGLAEVVRARLSGASRRQLVTEGRWVRRRVRRFLEDGVRLGTHDVTRLATVVSVSTEVRDVAWAEIDHANAGRHVDLWRDVVRRTPSDLQAPAAALLGFAAWLSGNGALAWCAVDRAQEADPGYGLAGLLTQALSGAVHPSAWRPLPADAVTLFAG